jgi:hypothetical protein
MDLGETNHLLNVITYGGTKCRANGDRDRMNREIHVRI